jgi:hypothetical protein
MNVATAALKELGQIVRAKPTAPKTCPSLQEALSDPAETVDSYYVTPSLRALLRGLFDQAVHRKGQGFWIRAEYGAGKTHLDGTATILLTNHDPKVWSLLHDDVLRRDYEGALTKLKLFPVAFSLMGMGEADAADSLVRIFEKEVRDALSPELRKKIPVLSEELAVEWYEKEAGSLIKDAIAAHFAKTHKMKPEDFRQTKGARALGAEIIKVAEQQKVAIDLKASFRERFLYLYDRITKLGNYDGLLFVVDEFRSWQDRHEGKPSFEEGVQFLETLAHTLPVDENRNILVVLASQGDCPQKLMGSGAGDRFIVRELLKEPTDYGEIVCFRVRDLLPGTDIDLDGYYEHCRKEFRFLKGITKDYFRAIFPFQPRCFDLLRRVTQSYERFGLPSARTGIHIAWETLRHEGLLGCRRLIVPSDLLASETLVKGLRSQQFKDGHDAYETALEDLNNLPLDDQERDLARRIVGTLYLHSVMQTDPGRGMSIDDLAEATLADLEGVHPKDAVLDLVTRLQSDLPQIKYDKTKGARFEVAEGGKAKRFDSVFGNFKKKAKADTAAQDRAWREALFWDFAKLRGAGSEEGFAGGFFDGYGEHDNQGNLLLPHTTAAKATPSGLKVQYGGEVVVADRWQPAHGEPWPNKPEVHFRIVYLTANAPVNKAELLDPRIAVCVPAALSADTRENLAELVACDLMLEQYNDKDYPGETEARERAKTRRHSAVAALLKNQGDEYRRGAIITQKELGLPASHFFTPLPKHHGKREEALAAQLLEKAYDDPLFNPKEFKKDFSDSDARKVFNGLFGKSPSAADNSARDNFAPGLGLVAKNDLTQLAPQPGSGVVRIQERLRAAGDLAVGELVKELYQPPHGLTEEMVRLGILCAVRAGNPPLMLAELNPAAGLKLANGKEPPGHRLTGKQITQVEWSAKLERAMLGARLKLSDEKPFNDVLPYARVLDANLTPASSPEEETARNAELCAALRGLASALPEVRDNLKKLAGVLGGSVEPATVEAFGRLEAIAATEDYLGFHEVVRANYSQPDLFQAAHELYERARRLTARYPDLQAARAYLDDLARTDDPQLTFEAQGLRVQLGFSSVWNGEGTLPAVLERYKQFREKYGLAYRKAHRAHHEALEKLDSTLAGLDDRLTVIARLNGLELGAPVGARLADEVRTLRDRVRPCPLKDTCRVDEKPRCNGCRWDGATVPPAGEVEQRVQEVTGAAGELCKRVAQEAIRKVLEATGQPDVRTLLDMITAAQVEQLAPVLTPDMVAKLKEILVAANVEHRDLEMAGILEGFTVVEEDRLDDFLKRLREQLKAAFDRAKRETEGKKRIRFFLK